MTRVTKKQPMLEIDARNVKNAYHDAETIWSTKH